MGRGWLDGRCVEGDGGDVRVEVGWERGIERERNMGLMVMVVKQGREGG